MSSSSLVALHSSSDYLGFRYFLFELMQSNHCKARRKGRKKKRKETTDGSELYTRIVTRLILRLLFFALITLRCFVVCQSTLTFTLCISLRSLILSCQLLFRGACNVLSTSNYDQELKKSEFSSRS